MNPDTPAAAPEPRLDRRDWLAALAVAALVAAAATPAVLRVKDLSDFRSHVGWAMTLDRAHLLQTPHFLYQLLTILVKRVFLLRTYMPAGVAVAVAADGAVGAVAAVALRRAGCGRALACAGGLALPFLAQVLLLLPVDGLYYWGYLAANVVHNANYTLLKPFALLSFLFAERALADPAPGARAGALAALTGVATTLAKPSFAIVFLPALAVAALWSLSRGGRVHVRYLALGVVLPVVAVLAWQWSVTYGPGAAAFGGAFGGKARLILAPLVVMRNYSSWLAPKLLLSLVFPLLATALLPGARAAWAVRLAWVAFVLGAACAYLLGESGERLLQGNMFWSAHIALLVLYFATLRALCRALEAVPPARWLREPRLAACLAALALHLASGVVWTAAIAAGGARG